MHTIDIQIDDWGGFVRNAAKEEYVSCDVTIDGETFRYVGLRAKGNNSLHLTEDYGLYRYSLKLEFDQYRDGGNYYGLDKFSLDASFQDNSYLKTCMTYDMMEFMGVPTPLCSFVQVTVNGEDWGLFLAIEEPEEAFARRNFGNDHGILYKPDYRSLNDENADVALKYIDGNPDSYPGIFDNAKFEPSGADQGTSDRMPENPVHGRESGDSCQCGRSSPILYRAGLRHESGTAISDTPATTIFSMKRMAS